MVDGPSSQRTNSPRADKRGVSNLVGIVLLFGIALFVIAAAGVFAVVFHVPEPTTTNPSTEFSFTTQEAGAELVIEHAGGDRIPADALRIQVSGVPGVRETTPYYWQNLSGERIVEEGDSVRLDRDSLNTTQTPDFGEGSVELTVEDGEDEYRVAQWAGGG